MAAPQPELFTKFLAAPEIGSVIADLVDALPAPAKAAPVQISIVPSINALALNITLPPGGQKNWRSNVMDAVKPLAEFSFLGIRSWTLTHPVVTIMYQSHGDIVGQLFIRKPDGQPFQQESERTVAISILRVLEKALPVQSRSALTAESMPEIAQEQLQYQHRTLADLQAATAKITSGITEFTLNANKSLSERQAELDRSYRERQDELDRSYREREAKLDETYHERRNELETLAQQQDADLSTRMSAREAAVAQREDELRKLKDELDLRDSTAARRANQRQIQQIIAAQSKVSITPETTKKRNFVHVLCAFGLLVFGALAAFFLYKIVNAQGDTYHWQFAVPFSTGLLGFASTLVYWIKWSDDWFREHARAEFANRKLDADAMRAAWLVELLLEWSHEGRDAMPSAVVESLTRNLFTDTQIAPPSHASDALQKFLNRLVNIRVNPDEIELDAGKKARSRQVP